MPITLPTDAGDYLALDAPGGVLLAEFAAGEFHYTKIDSTVPAPAVLADDEFWRVIRQSGWDGVGLDSPMLATGPGIDIDSTIGVRLFGAGGAVTILLSRADGSAMFAGDVDVGGTLDVTGPATFSDELHVGGESHLGGALFLEADLNAQGHTIEGARLTTGTGNVIIENNIIRVGASTIGFNITGVTFSHAINVTGAITGNSSLQITGTANLQGAARLAGAGQTLGAFGSIGSTIQTVRYAGRSNTQILDDIRLWFLAHNLALIG